MRQYGIQNLYGVLNNTAIWHTLYVSILENAYLDYVC
jgi:hypothetical protein